MRFPRSLPIALSLLSVSASPLVQAQGARKSHEPEPPYVRVAPLKTPVKVDGRISPGEWDEAFMATGVATYRKGGVDPMPVRYRLAYDKAHLYLSAQMETPPGLKLDRPQRRLAKSEELLRFELLVDPKSNHPDASWVQGMFYPLGKVQNVGYNQRIGGLVPYHVAWDYRDHWENGVWTLEASAPLSAFGRANFDPGEIWGVLFAGVAHAGPGYFSGRWAIPFRRGSVF